MNDLLNRHRFWWLAAGALALVVGGLGGVWLGVELTRRWPLEGLERPLERALERVRISLRPIEPWRIRARSPTTRYEALTAVVDGKLLVFGGFHNDAIQATSRVDEYDPVADRWRRLGDMPVPVTHGTAAVVKGEIWIAGGFVGDNPGPATDRVWRYRPGEDRWSEGPRLPAPRGSGGLVALPDGSLHYFGGWLPDRITDSPDHWRLEPGDSIWHPRSPLPNPRGHLSAVELLGQVYAIGGAHRHDPIPVDVAVVHRYDPVTDQWTEVASLPEPRSHAEPSTFTFDGRIYLAGGRSLARGKASARELLVYDPDSGLWSYAMTMPRGLLAPVAMAVRDEVILTAGGEDGSHPRNLTTWAAPLDQPWRPAPGMPEPLGEVAGGVIGQWLYLVGQGSRSTLVLNIGTGEWGNGRAFSQRPAATHHHAAEVVGEELYLIGGLEWTSVDIVQIYNPSRDEWRLGTSLRYPVGSSASAVIEGKIYLAGGIVGDTTTRQAVVFEPRLSVWRPIAPMPRARNHAASGTDGRRLFVFGGRGPGSGDGNRVANGYDDLQIYDPDTDTWVVSDGRAGSPLALPQARGGMGKAAYLGGEFYVIGGETLDGAGASAGGVYDRVDIYDPIRNQWRQGPPLPTARHGIFPVVYGPTIWVAGGGVKAAYSLSSVVEVLLLSASGH